MQGAAVYDPDEDLKFVVARAIKRLKTLNLDIQQQSTVDPALAWIRYRVREVEELLDPICRDTLGQRAPGSGAANVWSLACVASDAGDAVTTSAGQVMHEILHGPEADVATKGPSLGDGLGACHVRFPAHLDFPTPGSLVSE